MQPIRVISLERTPERREAFMRRNSHVRYSFFDAVDGSRLTRASIDATGLFAPTLSETYTAGAYGCAISHWKLWNEAAASAAPLTIAEDDAVFRDDFDTRSLTLLQALPDDWDLVLWGWNFDSVLITQPLPGVSPVVMLFDPESVRSSLDAFQRLTQPVHPLRLDKAFGMPAYTLSPRGAARMLRACFPMTDFTLTLPLLSGPLRNCGLDLPMNVAYPQTGSFASFPPLVVTPNDRAKSTSQNGIRPAA